METPFAAAHVRAHFYNGPDSTNSSTTFADCTGFFCTKLFREASMRSTAILGLFSHCRLRNGQVMHLGFNQLPGRFLVMVCKTGQIKRLPVRFDQLFRQVKLGRVCLHNLKVIRVLTGITNFRSETERIRESCAAGLDREGEPASSGAAAR
jgi:hypothetical protein